MLEDAAPWGEASSRSMSLAPAAKHGQGATEQLLKVSSSLSLQGSKAASSPCISLYSLPVIGHGYIARQRTGINFFHFKLSKQKRYQTQEKQWNWECVPWSLTLVLQYNHMFQRCLRNMPHVLKDKYTYAVDSHILPVCIQVHLERCRLNYL